MAESKRVVFSFDAQSYSTLEQMKKEGRFNSLADTVRQSLVVGRALQSQGTQGFTEVTVRNPKNGKERVLVLPTLVPEDQ